MATKKYKCKVCGYIHEGDKAPDALYVQPLLQILKRSNQKRKVV